MTIKASSVSANSLDEKEFIEYNLYSIPFISIEALVYRVKHRLIILNYMDFDEDSMHKDFNQPYKLVSNTGWIVKDLEIDIRKIVGIIHDNLNT